MFIHMGRMNSITVIFERLNEDLVSIHAAGYAMSRHSSVLTNATCMEYRKVFRSCGALKNLAKFARVKAPVWASPERIHYYHHERERDEQHQEYQIWKSPGGSRYLHFPAESLMFPGAEVDSHEIALVPYVIGVHPDMIAVLGEHGQMIVVALVEQEMHVSGELAVLLMVHELNIARSPPSR